MKKKTKIFKKKFYIGRYSVGNVIKNSMLFKPMFGLNGFPRKKINGLFFIRVLRKQL